MSDDFSEAHGFIFDCDGTLLDTLNAWEAAELGLFAEAGELDDAQQDEIHSAPIEEACRIFHERYGVRESVEAVLAHLEGFMLPFYRERVRALPGAVEFVHSIAEAGIPSVVLSSSPRRFLEAGLARTGMLDCFAELVTTDETGCSKRDNRIYERALAILGTTREQTWAVDDAPYAIEVMHDFGLNTIAPLNGCPPARAQRLGKAATIVVSSLEDLALANAGFRTAEIKRMSAEAKGQGLH